MVGILVMVERPLLLEQRIHLVQLEWKIWLPRPGLWRVKLARLVMRVGPVLVGWLSRQYLVHPDLAIIFLQDP